MRISMSWNAYAFRHCEVSVSVEGKERKAANLIKREIQFLVDSFSESYVDWAHSEFGES